MRGGFGYPPFGPPGWRGPGPGPGRGGRRGRSRRPNVRSAVLALLGERPMHGYEMIQELDFRTGGAWRPSPGSVYPTLRPLEDEGPVATATDDAGGRKRFQLTEAGRAEAEPAARSPPWAPSSPRRPSTAGTRSATRGSRPCTRFARSWWPAPTSNANGPPGCRTKPDASGTHPRQDGV